MMELPINQVMYGDFLAVLKTFPDNSVDAIKGDCSAKEQSQSHAIQLCLGALEGRVAGDTLPTAKRLFTVKDSVCFNLKLFLAHWTRNSNTCFPMVITTFIRAKKFASLGRFYSPQLFCAEFSAVRTLKSNRLYSIFMCACAGAETTDSITGHKWFLAIFALFCVFLNGFMPGTFENFTFPILPLEPICARKRATFIRMQFNRLIAHFAKWFCAKCGCGTWHRQSTVQSRIKERIGQLNPIMFRTPYMTVMTTCHKIGEGIGFVNTEPVSLRNEVMGDEIASSPTIGTNLVARDNITGYSSPRFPFIRPFPTSPCWIAGATHSSFVGCCHATFFAVNGIVISGLEEIFTLRTLFLWYSTHTLSLLYLASYPGVLAHHQDNDILPPHYTMKWPLEQLQGVLAW